MVVPFLVCIHKCLISFTTELSGGTLAAAVPLHSSNITFLLGGGRSPLYPLNKVIMWNDIFRKEVAELEFRERVRGIACRRGWLAVSLRHRVVVFQADNNTITRYAEWDTCDNPRGERRWSIACQLLSKV